MGHPRRGVCRAEWVHHRRHDRRNSVWSDLRRRVSLGARSRGAPSVPAEIRGTDCLLNCPCSVAGGLQLSALGRLGISQSRERKAESLGNAHIDCEGENCREIAHDRAGRLSATSELCRRFELRVASKARSTHAPRARRPSQAVLLAGAPEIRSAPRGGEVSACSAGRTDYLVVPADGSEYRCRDPDAQPRTSGRLIPLPNVGQLYCREEGKREQDPLSYPIPYSLLPSFEP